MFSNEILQVVPRTVNLRLWNAADLLRHSDSSFSARTSSGGLGHPRGYAACRYLHTFRHYLDFWDKSAKNYDKTEERFAYIHSKSRENTKKYLKERDVVLDYGCGTGTTSCELSSRVKEIHALDISSKMIAIAQGKAVAGNVKNVDFVQTDIFDERYKKESFDVILAFNMLHTVPAPHTVLQRIYELLKPEGSFISVTPCLREKLSFLVSAQIQLVRLLCKIGIIPISIRRVKSSELEELVLRGKFQILATETIYKGASSYFMVAKKSDKSATIAA